MGKEHSATKYGGSEIVSNTTRGDGTDKKLEAIHKRFNETTEPGKPGRAFNWREYGPAIRRWETILNRPAPEPVKNNRLNPWFVEFMMGINEGLVCGEDLGLTVNQQLKLLGNGVVKHQAYEAYRKLLNER